MSKKLFTFLATFIAIVLLTSPVQAQSFIPYQPYHEQTTFYRAPYTETSNSLFNRNQNSFSNTYSFDTFNNFDRSFRDVRSLNNQFSFTGSQTFNNRDFSNNNRNAFINNNFQESFNKGPCQTFTDTEYANFDGKRRDYRIVRESQVCDNIRINRNTNNQYIDSINTNSGHDNRDFGRFKTAIDNRETVDYRDISNNRERARERETSNFFSKNFQDKRQTYEFFNYFY